MNRNKWSRCVGSAGRNRRNGQPTGTVREYIYLPETEIAPTAGSRTVVDRPIAVVDAVSTAPVMWQVHVDHLNRPIKMTDATKASVWDVVWGPWDSPYTISGTATLDARFPGQWYQLESGLHYNWHRHYDPTLGRYTQPDPLGFVDGPSVYGYVEGEPLAGLDIEGLSRLRPPGGRRVPGRIQYNPDALDYTPRPTPSGGVYTLRDPRQPDIVCRVGRTNDFDRREQELLREYPNLQLLRDFPTNDYNQQRGREQQLYDLYNPPLNLIRPISPRNRNYDRYMNSIR